MNDDTYMRRCLQLANLGKGFVAPNPLVGAVIVHKNKIIGEGYHMQYGKAHAEVNAVNSVKNKELLKDSTIYVNLEPCAHFGKTPPCANLIVDVGIPKVVIGCVDSFAAVAGKGIAILEAAGIDVRVGVLEKEALELNRRFFTFHAKKRPYVILKWAQSSDGFIDIDRKNNEQGIAWITQPETQVLVHKWRHEEAAILVGKNTVKNDNPELTCRTYKGNSPIRIVIDEKMRLDYGGFKVGDRSVLTYIFTKKKAISKGNLQFITLEDFSTKGILEKLFELNIQSVIIEGGENTLSRFINEQNWDEARVLQGKTTFNSGTKAPKIAGNMSNNYSLGIDSLTVYTND
jgi:diaminohydroxyphosphoribosylaminopyrimidine deaminase/5-amino-6-(5-phosphoribosylamino)uracil reductase